MPERTSNDGPATTRPAAPARWRAPAGWAAGGLVGFVLIAAFVDAPVTRALTAWPPEVRAFFGWLTQWGEAAWVLVPALLVWAAMALVRLARPRFWARWTARAIAAMSGFVFLAVGLPGLAGVVLKRLIGRARPWRLDELGTLWFDPVQPLNASLQSLPSGHATTSFAFAVALVALFGRVWGIVFVLAVLIAMSRIVVGAHFLSDAIAGAVLGTLGAIWVREWFAARRWVLERRDGRLRNRLAAPVGRLWRRRSAQRAAR